MSQIAESCGGGEAGRQLVPGSLRGYRTWRLRRRDVPEGMLPMTSLTRRHVVWTPTLTARCAASDLEMRKVPEFEDHSAPHLGCNCGIYAWYTPDDTARLKGRIFGAVEASGLVLMGDRGFRAERVRVVAVVTRKSKLAVACQQAGITVYAHRRELVGAYPPEDVSALIGGADAPVPRQPMVASTGFHSAALFAVWARTAVMIAAAVALPATAALIAVAAAHLALILLLVCGTR
jgi:hypothetical protein